MLAAQVTSLRARAADAGKPRYFARYVPGEVLSAVLERGGWELEQSHHCRHARHGHFFFFVVNFLAGITAYMAGGSRHKNWTAVRHWRDWASERGRMGHTRKRAAMQEESEDLRALG